MDPFAGFAIQNAFSLVVYGLLAGWYVWPRLTAMPLTSALTALTFIHAFRSVGATILVPSVGGSAVSHDFATTLANGDLGTATLAVIALIALRARWRFAIALVVVTNLVGVLDLLDVLVQAVQNDSTHAALGAFWYVPTYLVPILWIASFMTFALLLRNRGAMRAE